MKNYTTSNGMGEEFYAYYLEKNLDIYSFICIFANKIYKMSRIKAVVILCLNGIVWSICFIAITPIAFVCSIIRRLKRIFVNSK